jgi:hypothetical protein
MDEVERREPRAPARNPAARLIGLLAAVGLGLALAALAVTAVAGPGSALAVLFWCGWTLLAAAMIAGLFVLAHPLPIARPLRVIAFGVLTVVLAFVLEALARAPGWPLRVIGTAALAAGLLWALWVIGGSRR